MGSESTTCTGLVMYCPAAQLGVQVLSRSVPSPSALSAAQDFQVILSTSAPRSAQARIRLTGRTAGLSKEQSITSGRPLVCPAALALAPAGSDVPEPQAAAVTARHASTSAPAIRGRFDPITVIASLP